MLAAFAEGWSPESWPEHAFQSKASDEHLCNKCYLIPRSRKLSSSDAGGTEFRPDPSLGSTWVTGKGWGGEGQRLNISRARGSHGAATMPGPMSSPRINGGSNKAHASSQRATLSVHVISCLSQQSGQVQAQHHTILMPWGPSGRLPCVRLRCFCAEGSLGMPTSGADACTSQLLVVYRACTDTTIPP